MVPVAVLLLAAAAALGVLRSRHPSAPPRPVVEPGTEVMPALTPRATLLGALVLLGVGVTGAVLLLVHFSGTEPRDRLDAIRIAATLLVGTGGAAALLLAARRQRATELTLAVQHKAAADTAHDAAARRITELYLKAVEQLGSDKAAVRHGGLYALERVAHDNPDQRQTVLNVICAYLRSPYTPTPKPPAAARVVYTDNDPVVLAHAHALLADEGKTHIAAADIYDPGQVYGDPMIQTYIDFTRPVGLIHSSTIHHYPGDDYADLMRHYIDPLPSGAWIALSHFYDPEQPELSQVTRRMEDIFSRSAMGSGWFRTREQILSMMPGLDIVAPQPGMDPTVVPCDLWWPDGPVPQPLTAEQELIGCVVGYKP